MNNKSLEKCIDDIWDGILVNNPDWNEQPLTKQEKQKIKKIHHLIRNETIDWIEGLCILLDLYIDRLFIKNNSKIKNYIRGNLKSLSIGRIKKYTNDFLLLWKIWNKEIKGGNNLW